MSQQELKLPEGWYDVELGNPNVSKIVMGQSPPSSTYNQEKNGLPFFQGTKDFGKKNPTVTVWCSKPNRIAEKGDMLFSVRAPVGTINWANEKCCIGRGLASIRPKINSEYVYYFLKLIESELILSGSGSIFNSITKDELHKRKISIAPLNEQKRIVSKIEELFSRIDSAKQSLEHTKLQLEQYKVSFLKSIFEGKITKNWNVIKINELTKSRKLGLVRSIREQSTSGTPYLKMNNITTDGQLDLRSIVYVNCSDQELGNYLLEKNDILFNTRNSLELVGKTTIWDNSINNCIFNNNIMRIRTNNKILPKLLCYFMNSNMFKTKLLSVKKGTTNICAIYDKDLKEQLIPFPIDIKQQEQIVSQIEQGFSLIENTSHIVEFSLQNLQTMKMSVLKQAFEGKLVPQDPNDEPASVLLERIKSTKESQLTKHRRIKNVK